MVFPTLFIKVKFLNKSEFEKSLRIGLGSAILHLQSQDYSLYEDSILNACLHNISYDPQIEGYKTSYLIDIIKLTDNVGFFREQILQATSLIDEDTDYHDVRHLVELTSAFAKEGDSEARKIIYNIFNANLEDEDPLGGRNIIEIDGIEGFVYVATKLGDLKQNDTEPKADDYYLWTLEEIIGEETAKIQLSEIRQLNKSLDFYLNLVEKSRYKPKSSREVFAPAQTYAEVKATSKNISSNLVYWGQTASKDDLELVAYEFIKEHDPNSVVQYLRLFRRVPFPLEPQLLFRFMDMEHPSGIFLSAMTISALALIEHPSVRELALSLINEDKHSGLAVRLLARNYEEVDWKLIENLGEKITDPDEYHDFARSVQDVFELQSSSSATQTLRNMYYNNPCSFCREIVLDRLHRIGGLNTTILDECRYDSNLDIREWTEKITLD